MKVKICNPTFKILNNQTKSEQIKKLKLHIFFK